MNYIQKLWERDKQVFRFIKRLIVYQYYRFEHYRLTKTRLQMEKIKYVSKEDIKQSNK